MTAAVKKNIVVPIDGSEKCLKCLDYVKLVFGLNHPLYVTFLYIHPTLPPLLVDEKDKNPAIAKKLKEVEAKNIKMAERILSEGKSYLLNLGFKENHIKTIHRKKEIGIARDICHWADYEHVDAIMISTRGRTRLQSFFMGEVSRRVLEYRPQTPTWMLEPVVRKRGVLIAVDSSENALRAVDHAGFMLAGTDCPVTLFHVRRQLQSFVPKEILQESPDLEDLWKDTEEQQISPYIQKAKEKLLKHGLSEDQITVKLWSSRGNVSADIRKAAKDYDCGTIVLGRCGLTGVKELIMGSVTRKILESFSGIAVWIVK